MSALINPIKTFRQLHNLTQRSLAEQAGMSPTAVLRYEQGLYQELSEKISGVFTSLDEEAANLPEAYRTWRKAHQLEAKRYINPLPNLMVISGEHPFTTWRRTVTTRAVGKDSRVSFCILLAIHPGVVLEYEKGKQRHMPHLIKEALINAGASETYVKSLDDLGAIYHDRLSNS